MDLALDQAQDMLRASARDFLQKECPTTLVRDLEKTDRGYSPDLWRKMADLGWVGLGLPSQFGGGDGTIIDQIVLMEEIGRAMLPSPILSSSVRCGQLILNTGNDAQKQKWLPPMAGGQAVFAVAYAEAGITMSTPITTTLKRDGKDYVANGSKFTVPFGASVDYIIIGAQGEEGLTFGIVESKAPGITVKPLKSVANDPRCQVGFKNVKVSADNVLPGGEPFRQMLDYAALCGCGEMLGRAQKVLELVVDYGKTRVQFGRPIGAFQAVQHQCADLRVAIDAATLLIYNAATAMLEGRPCAEEVSLAKAKCNEMSRFSTFVGHGIFAGYSYTVEHDMQLYSSRNKLAESSMGNSTYHLGRIADQMGL
jgi:alkylation response protein AidB-like acyl-CoA dehydrogenase